MLYFKLIFSFLIFGLAGKITQKPLRPAKPIGIEQALSFEAISDGKKVVVSWTTPSERKFDYFTIEKSKDGQNFVSAVMIKGAGKISTLVDYTDVDYSPYSGISYYRLKETDYYGEVAYSEAVLVNFQFLKDGSIVPQSFKVPDEKELQEIANNPVLVVMKDVKGHEYVSKIQISVENGTLYGSENKNSLNHGTYLITASSCNRLSNQKLIVK